MFLRITILACLPTKQKRYVGDCPPSCLRTAKIIPCWLFTNAYITPLEGTTSDQLRGRTQKRDNPPRSIAEAKMRSNRPGHTIFSFSDQNTPGFTLLSVNLETISHSNPSRPTTQQAEADSKRQKNTGSAWHGKYKNDDAARDEEARDKLKKGDKRTGN